MKTVSMSGSLREGVGKKDAKALRREGRVPCVLYGGQEQVQFHLDQRDFKGIVFTPNTYLVDMKLGENTHKCILKDIQYHPVSDDILHADFYEVSDDKPVKISIPVRTTGVSKGVVKGGKLHLSLRKLYVEALVKDLPDEITVDITKLDIGDGIKVKDLSIQNIAMLDTPSALIAKVKTARGTVAGDDEEEGGAEGGAEGEAEGEAAAPSE